jgi:hypothetical protein
MEGIILFYESAHPHVANSVPDQLNAILWAVLKHPAYSTDLWPCNFHIFGPLKKDHKFTLDDSLQEALVQWYRQQPKEFLCRWICQLVYQQDSCLNPCSDFF